MNILVDRLPTAVCIDGVEYKINSNFRACLQIILAFEDPELTEEEKQIVLLQNLYPVLPNNIPEAIIKGIKFLDGGKDEEVNQEDGAKPRLYSFSQDADFIFSAFKQTHNIDLSDTEYLHWWKFLALFMDLGQDTTFCNLISLRKRVKAGKATKEERQAANEMGKIFDLPENQDEGLTYDEREVKDEFLEQVLKAQEERDNGSRL